MLDAGHYGDYNRSPAVPEYYESRMSWALQERLAAELERYGIEVERTRTDRFTDLEVYARGAKAKDCDMFLSLHSNAVGSGVREDVDRPVVIRLSNDTAEGNAFARRLADSIAQLMGTRQSAEVTTRLMNNGGEYYGVLRGARAVGCPHAYIVEHSFHTATAPSKWLLDERNLDALAALEASLVAEFFGIELTEKEEAMTAEEKLEFEALKLRVAELERRTRIYHWYSELPDYARPTIERLHKSGVFSGAGPGDMQLSRDMMRILLVLANRQVI